jgi:hypothetical protein
MLDEARARARARGLRLQTVCADAQSFIQGSEPASFDAVSLRFCLAYLPWRELLGALSAMLRPAGRLGILTNLGSSAPQALATYRGMVEELNVPAFDPSVPASLDELSQALERAGFTLEQAWTHRFRLWFDAGAEVSAWLAQSGFITHPALSAAPRELQRALWGAFATRVERYREDGGIPLDFELAGVVATRSTLDA